jgi:hypothetical protein
MEGVIKLGPGEEKEAATGACGLPVVTVRSMVPTGLLHTAEQDYFHTTVG